MGAVGRVAAVIIGSTGIVAVIMSAVRTVVLPRGEPVALTRALFLAVRRVFDVRTKRAKSYEEVDRIMALYAPVSLMLLPFTWVALSVAASTFVFWGLGTDSPREAFVESGSSLLTLGFSHPPNLPSIAFAYVEATVGLGLIALLISFLPSIYSAFQRRELAVAALATRAGDPPSAMEMIVRHHRLGRLDALDDLWDQWETWFADVEETHTSQPSLVFFRSISHDRSWVTSAGVLLDTAAIRSSALALPRNPRAELCLRAGYLALGRIADYFQIERPVEPRRGDPISVEQSEFNDMYERLAREGVPLRPDRELAWLDFAGWRVNYDAALLGLAALTLAPYALWSSDRSIRVRYPRIVTRRRTRRRPRRESVQ